MLVAITRGVSNHIGACELSHLPRIGIDVALAREQHGRYEDALRRAGCRVVSLPPLHDYPDAVFVEDTAIVLDELAILTRPGAASRRMETATVADALRSGAGFAPVDDPGISGTLGGAETLKASRAMAETALMKSVLSAVRSMADKTYWTNPRDVDGPRSKLWVLNAASPRGLRVTTGFWDGQAGGEGGDLAWRARRDGVIVGTEAGSR
jgi:hypothetical protein